MKIKVTAQEKEVLLAHCRAVDEILGKYPYFEPGNRYLVTCVNRCKRISVELLRHVETLPVEDNNENINSN